MVDRDEQWRDNSGNRRSQPQSSLEVHECVATNVKKSSSLLLSEVSPQSNSHIGFLSFCSSRPNGVLIREKQVVGYPL